MLEWVNANLSYVVLGAISFLLLVLIMIILFHKDKKVISNKPTAEESLALMQKTLDSKVETVSNYEDDQEQKAIISYKELVKSKEETERKENKTFSSVDEYFDYLNREQKQVPVETKIVKEETIIKNVPSSKEEDFLKSLKDFRSSL